MNFNFLKRKNILVTGGTGSFGKTFIKEVIRRNVDFETIKVFSRDEAKQHDLRTELNDPRVNFIVGDVRDEGSLMSAMNNVDYVFHAAALKQVPSCEFFPNEAVMTNIMGSYNVAKSAIKNNVKKCIFLSTDKAVYPINSMGATKFLMEKLTSSFFANDSKTQFSVTRYGNVLASRGSILPNLASRIRANQEVFLTHEKMTRYVMTLTESIDLVLYALSNNNKGLYVYLPRSALIKDMISAMFKYLGKKTKVVNIGIRHGEKINESLITIEELAKIEQLSKNFFYVKPDERSLNYEDYFDNGDLKDNYCVQAEPLLSSDNAKTRLNVDQLVKLYEEIGI